MNSIIPRTTGLSNQDMLNYCDRLKRIVLETREVKVGRGRVIETKQVLKHKTATDVIKRITDSCEYYKSLNEMEMERKQRFELRDYQQEIARKGTEMLLQNRFLYLAMQVRTGKTLTSLSIAENVGAQLVLFITKKKALSSIEKDYNLMKPSFYMRAVNYESLHLAMDEFKWDLIICDEAHSMGAFPKPSDRAEMVGGLISRLNPFVILLSGTPTPESYSQMYHQVYRIPGNPFSGFKNFYRFCDIHVKVKQKKINGQLHNDYTNGLDSILEAMKPYTINYTQKEAGFNSEITEEVLEVDMKESTYKLIERLRRDLVIMGKEETILADTPVKLMSKIHQLCSGTIKFESGNSMIVDTSKAEFIKKHFDGCKIGIFYKFKEELNVLKQVFGDSLTTELSVFEDTDKNIALQIVSGREGLSLKMADYLVYYNIDFSATSYWQSRDRMTTIDRPNNDVYWIFSRNGIERSIYKAVVKKKDYTIKHFKKDYEI